MTAGEPFGGAPLLADTSAWAWAKSLPPDRHAEWTAAVSGLQVRSCVPVVHELGQGAFTADDLDALYERHSALPQQQIGSKEMRTALVVMARLARLSSNAGYHRGISLTDVLLAVTAARHGLTVLHYDDDFDRLREAVDFDHIWIASDGSLEAVPTIE